jgi:hypothetical protein
MFTDKDFVRDKNSEFIKKRKENDIDSEEDEP